jgi:pilus assembly protein CpaF
MEPLDELAVALRGRLVERARDGRVGGSLEGEVQSLVEDEAAPLPQADREELAARVVLLATGLGPLEPLLADPSVDEVMVNGPGSVYVERRGRIERAAVEFAGPDGQQDGADEPCDLAAGADVLGDRGARTTRR